MNRQHLLPGNRTSFEEALSETLDFLPELMPEAEAVRGFKFQVPAPDWLSPWLVFDYVLGEIAFFFNSADDLVENGIAWQRLIGTPAAIDAAFGWIEYNSITLKDQFPSRRMWHRYQIAMGELPGVNEVARLGHAEYLAGLSDPARSIFFRGYHGYDVPPLTWGDTRWGDAIWGDDSGVRLAGGTTKWSHGQAHELSIVGDADDREALGIDVEEGGELSWGDFPWDAPGASWAGIVDVPVFRSFLLRRLPVYIGFYGAGGPIGYRRVYRVTDVSEEHEAEDDELFVEFECRTGFGDGAGQTVTHVALVFRCAPSNLTRPGKLWLAPNEIAFEVGVEPADMKIGAAALSLTLKETVRERVVITLEI